MVQPEFLSVPADALRANPWNTNVVNPDNEAKIRASIQRNGLFKPIIVREVPGVPGYEIVGGEHRWQQACELGYTEIPICNLGTIDDRKAKEIGVIDNAAYGADDTLSFAELLREIGDIGELQDFLPYGDADLNAIFSASNIALDDLGVVEEAAVATEDENLLPSRPAKTHTIMRFKVSLGDAERITAAIARLQKEQGFTSADDLTNAGDALVFALASHLSSTTTYSDPEDLDQILEAAIQSGND